MKKRRIMATITALAVAAAGFFVPASEKNGINIASGAILKDGGLHLSKELQINEANLIKILDPDSDEYLTGKAVAAGEIVQVNILVPELPKNLASVQFKMQYDSSVFECVQWYRTGNEPKESDFVYNSSDKKYFKYIDASANIVYQYGSGTTAEYLDENKKSIKYLKTDSTKQYFGIDKIEVDTSALMITTDTKDFSDTDTGYTKYTYNGDYVVYNKNSTYKDEFGNELTKKEEDGKSQISIYKILETNNLKQVTELDGYTLADVQKMADESWPSISSFGSDLDVNWESNFKDAGDTANTKKISLTANLGGSGGEKVPIELFSGNHCTAYSMPGTQATRIEPDGNYTVLVAKFKVKKEMEQADDYKHPNFTITEHLFYSDSTYTGPGEDQWDPGTYKIATCFITGKITGKLIDCQGAYDSERKEDLYIHVDVDPSVLAWYNTVNGLPLPDKDVKVDEDGYFEINGLIPGTPLTLTVHTWCLYGEKKILGNQVKNMVTSLGNWSLWLYGDVNHDGYIAADDVTQILKYIVGKPSVLDGAKKTDDRFKAANVTYEKALGANNGDEVINVLDATQILRSIYGWIGNDATSKSVFTIHSNKYLFEAFPAHSAAGETFPVTGKTYIK